MISQSFASLSLNLEPAINTYFLTAEVDTPLIEALAIISHRQSSCILPHTPQLNLETIAPQFNSSCILVLEAGKLLSVFTERDIVRLTANGNTLKQLKLGDVIQQPLIALAYSPNHDLFSALSLLRQHRIRHLPIIDQQGTPIGIVSQDSIRRVLQPVNLLTRLRYVRDVMTTDVIQATSTTSILELAQLMTKYRVSCIIISQKSELNPDLSNPIGIVTERDIVQFQALEVNLAHTQAKTVMSSPLFSLSPHNNLWLAHQTMNKHRVRRLVVVGQGGELLGIVSQTSLLQVLNPSDMYGLIEALQEIVNQRTLELEQTNQQLRYEIREREKAELALQNAHDQLKQQVENQTAQLRQTNLQLQTELLERQQIEIALRQSEQELIEKTKQLEQAVETLQHTQLKLIQTEKMSSLAQLVAGIAHEINNPINFIYGNLIYAE